MKRVLLLAMSALSAIGFAQSSIIAQLKPGASPTAIAAAFGITYKEKAPGGPFFLFIVPPHSNAGAIEDAMKLRNDVVWVEDDGEVNAPENESGGKGSSVAVINDRLRAYALNATALNQVGFSRPFTLASGRVTKVAILDTGIDPACTILWNKAVAKYNTVEGGLPYDIRRMTDSNGNGLKDEGVGHGTFVAGIIDQLSPQSRLVVIRVADSDGNSSAWRLIKGISYAVVQGAEVANISLGSLNTIPALSNVISWADAYGLNVVAAAGNNNLQKLCQPAALSKVLGIAGVDGTDHKASFSNYDRDVSQSAPATGIRSYGPNNRMMIWSGTSFAAPFASGALIECLRHVPSRLPGSKVRRAMQNTGADIDGLNPTYRGMLGLRLSVPALWQEIRLIAPGP